MKILMLTHRLPYAPNRGDRIRSYYLLRFLRDHAQVHLLSLVEDAEEASQARSCPAASVRTVVKGVWRNRAAAVAALPTRKPLTHVLLDAPSLAVSFRQAVAELRPDVVLAYCTGTAHLIGLLPPDVPVVLDMVDVDSVKWQQLSATVNPVLGHIYRREARCLGAFEVAMIRRASVTFVVNERERRLIEERAPDLPVQVLPNGIDVPSFRPVSGPAANASVVFCGVLDYPPNEQAAEWLAQDIWPRVLARVPEARLTLVGANPTERIRRLAADHPSITVTGRVPDTRPYLWNGAVSVAPLRTARGIQNKVLEALAAKLPVVTTSAVYSGLPDSVRAGCLVADSAEESANALVRLLQASPEQRRALSERAGLEQLSWDRQFARLPGILQGICRRPMGVVA